MTKKLYKYCLCAALLFISALGLYAQAGWIVSHAEGNLSLTRDRRRANYQNGSEIQGIQLEVRDMLQTERGTAELQLVSGDVMVFLKLSENTSITIDEFADRVSLEFLYGRIRVLSNSPVAVRCGNSAAIFETCDAVVDYVARPGVTQPALTVHCFEGSGELITRSPSGTENVNFPINRGESLFLEYQIPFIYMERKSPDADIAAYRRDNPFSSPDSRRIASSSRTSAADRTANQRRERDQPRQASFGIKNGYILTGLLMIGAGAAMQGYSYIGNPNPELRDRLFYGAYGPLGLGAVFLLGALAVNPGGSANR